MSGNVKFVGFGDFNDASLFRETENRGMYLSVFYFMRNFVSGLGLE